MIQNDEIWATHTQYLNDRREFTHALDLVRTEVANRKANTTKPEERIALDEMLAALAGNLEAMNVCVCSFSEDDDSLSQWRAYSGTGSGFAVGFRGEFLAEKAKEENAFLVRCVYELEQQQKIVREFIGLILEEVLRHRNIERTDENYDFWHTGGNLRAYVNRLAPVMKDSSFADEREWRIISRPLMCTLERFAYRQGKSTIIPYYRLPLSNSPDKVGRPRLREVVIGPTPDLENSERAVRSLLASQRLASDFTPGGPVSVKTSKIPYRTW